MVKMESKYNYSCSLHQWGQMQVLQKLTRFARKTPREQLESVRYHLEELDWYWKIHKPENQRTTYIISLFGGGRLYLNELMLQNIGERTKYFRKHIIRLHPVRLLLFTATMPQSSMFLVCKSRRR